MVRAALFLSLLLGSAEPMLADKIEVITKPAVDFSLYKTYEWLPGRVLTKHGLVDEGPAVTPAVKASVNAQMTSRGFREVEKGGDIQISYWAMTASYPQIEAVFWNTWVSPLDASNVVGFGGSPTVIGRYNNKGTLALNLIDAKTNKSLWAALCSDTVDSEKDVRKKVPKVVGKAFRKFPVKLAK